MDVGSACSGSGFLGVKSMREVKTGAFDCNDGFDRRWPAADEDAPRREVADHTKLRYGCGVCVQRQRLVGGEKYEGSAIYVSFSHDFHPQNAAAAARRPHIHTSVLCDLQLLSAEHPRPLQASGDPAHQPPRMSIS